MKKVMNQQKFLGYLLGSIASVIMASLGFFVRNTSANAQIITLSRFGIGFFFLVFYLFLTNRINLIRSTKFSFALISSGIFLSLCILFYIKAINTISLVNAVFLLYLGPLIATGLAVIFLKESLTLSKILLLSFAFLGCLFLLEFKLSFNQIDLNKYCWGILSAIFYGLFIVENKQINSELSSLVRSFWQLFFGVIALLFCIDITAIEFKHTDLYWLIAIGFLHGFIAVTLAISSLKRLEAYEYSMISYLEPLVATILGLFVYAEIISKSQIIGCLIIFISGILQLFLSKNQ